eukprot:1035517-Pyramimonas_sp.AAC.1
MGSSTEGASGRVRMAARPISAHLSRGSCPQRELHRRRQWQGSHGGPAPFRRTPHEDRGRVGSSRE